MKKKKVFIGIGITAILIVIITANIMRYSGEVPAFSNVKAREVEVQKITGQDITQTITASGVVEEIEKREIYFDTPLKVKKVLVKENEPVKKGQQLIELDMDSLLSEYEQLKINQRIQELTVEKLRQSDGTQSTAALEVAVEQALTAVANDERNLENAKSDLAKYQKLYESGAISKSELEQYERAVEDLTVKLRSSKLSYESAKANLDSVIKSNNEVTTQRNIDLESQEQALKLRILAVNDMEKKLEKIKESIVSPIDGVVTEVLPVEGGYVSTAQPAFTIIDDKKLQIRADVKEYDIKKVKVGQEVRITGDALDANDQVIGRVKSVSSTAKQSRTAVGEETLVEVLIDIEQSSSILKPGLSVTCKITTETRRNVPVVTFMMLRSDKDGNRSVFVVDEKGYLRERPVTIGITSDLNAEVIDGVKIGDAVVVNPAPYLKDGELAKITNKY